MRTKSGQSHDEDRLWTKTGLFEELDKLQTKYGQDNSRQIMDMIYIVTFTS